MINQRRILSQGIADAKIRMTDKAHHVARVCFVQSLTIAAKELV